MKRPKEWHKKTTATWTLLPAENLQATKKVGTFLYFLVAISFNEITIDDTPPLPRRAKKRKLVKEPVMVETNSTLARDEPAITSKVTKLKPKKKASEKHAAKNATIAASNATAKSLFDESDEIKRLNEKIQKLQEDLQHERDLVYYSKVVAVTVITIMTK